MPWIFEEFHRADLAVQEDGLTFQFHCSSDQSMEVVKWSAMSGDGQVISYFYDNRPHLHIEITQ